ncbi:MAG: hypothetical protein WDM86_16230 [Rhizomicrobium sp.]
MKDDTIRAERMATPPAFLKPWNTPIFRRLDVARSETGANSSADLNATFS